MRDDSSVSKRVGAAGIALLVALSMVAGVGLVSAGGTDGATSPEASVTFENQTTEGETVVVEEVTLEEGGFVAIHEQTEDGGVGGVIGVTEYLEAGTHEDVEATLFTDAVEGGDFEQSMLEEDGTLIAMPHLDTDGDEAYEFVSSAGEVDGPYTEDGGAVVDPASVTVEAMDDAEDGSESQKADKKAQDDEEGQQDEEEQQNEEDEQDDADEAEGEDDADADEDMAGEDAEDMDVTAEDVEDAMEAMGMNTDMLEEMGMTAQDIADLLNEMFDAIQSIGSGSPSA
ncbi:hypothetical protein BRC86_06480 [Halobacteriales archaeon QS_3_64_16]|nr:MAG: hypothetical protein BRC86_06480 [Halobacteriales archaeon QS_3_64_16]